MGFGWSVRTSTVWSPPSTRPGPWWIEKPGGWEKKAGWLEGSGLSARSDERLDTANELVPGSGSNRSRLTDGATARGAVPIRRRILQTLAGRHPLPPFASDLIEQKRAEIRHRWLDQVMLDGEVIRPGRYAEKRLDHLSGLVNRRGEEVHRILRVQVKIYAMVSQRPHVGITSRRIVALGIRRAHVGRVLANHIRDSSFVLDHLLFPHVRRYARQAVMRPGMRGDLVTFTDHAPEQAWPGGRGIDLTFSQIVPGHEERCREAILFEEVEEFGRINIWTIIICQSHHVRLGAAVDILIIRYLAQKRPRIREG